MPFNETKWYLDLTSEKQNISHDAQKEKNQGIPKQENSRAKEDLKQEFSY